jgi:hypothetical protein
MITCPHCLKDFIPTRRKRTDEEKRNSRHAHAWKYTEEIYEKYQSGDAIMWLAREYKSDRRTIRNILREKGVIVFRGRKGIACWNKGKEIPSIQGASSPHWKGGVTPLNMKVRRCAKYRQWVKDIFKRDNWTCVNCGKRGGDLEADHYPIRFAEIMREYKLDTFEKAKACKELWDLGNGRTLCLNCHNKTKNQVSKL